MYANVHAIAIPHCRDTYWQYFTILFYYFADNGIFKT